MSFQLFLLALVLPFIGPVDNGDHIESVWTVSGTSRVLVEGQSNVNEFQCVTLHYEGKDKLEKRIDPNTRNRFLTGSIEMKVRSFDCENRMMTRDLRETLKEDLYPTISIELISLRLPEKLERSQKVRGEAEITIAGNTRVLDLTWTLSMPDRDKMRLSGNRELKFSQFGLEAPTKMMGMIRVRDELFVDFDLLMEMDERRVN
jgi:hypothetical protein